MTTLIIEVPDSVTEDITNIVNARGGNVVYINSDDENLTLSELEQLKRGIKEAMLIKGGKVKSIPFSETWND